MGYRADHGELPPNLTTLFRERRIDPRLLICPVHATRGTNRPSDTYLRDGLANDPMTLYIWEFSPEYAAWKERQRAIGAGDWVPIVRCREHSNPETGFTQLNLSLGGAVYPSGQDWEYQLRQFVPHSYLASIAISQRGEVIPLRDRIPGRLSESKASQVDLGPAFNAAMADPWPEGWQGEEVPELSNGQEGRIWRVNGHDFEVRGVVQIEGRRAAAAHPNLKEPRFPFAMQPLPVDFEATTLHLLCGAINEQAKGTVAGRLLATDDSGETHQLILKYGTQVAHGPELEAPENAKIVWARECIHTDDYRLQWRLLPTADDLQSEGRSEVIVALVNEILHVRVFDSHSVMIVDKRGSELREGDSRDDLRNLLNTVPIPDAATMEPKLMRRVFRKAIACTGHTPSLYGIRSVSHVEWPLGRKRRIVKVEFSSADTASYPFLLALTAE